MTRPFALALKQQMVSRLTGVNAVSAAQLARETGITQQSLSRWLSEARNSPFLEIQDHTVTARSAEEKAQIIAHAAALRGDELAAYLKVEQVQSAQLRSWRLALEEAGDETTSLTKRIRRLERELIRKDRALAEAATLLILRESSESPNPAAAWADVDTPAMRFSPA